MICTHWQRMTHFNFTFPDTRQTPPCYSSPRGSGPFELKNFNSPSSPLSLCPFFPVLPFLLMYVMHQLCDSFGSLFLLSFILSFFLCGSSNPLSLVFFFLTPPYFATDIAFTRFHSNSLLCIRPMLMFLHNHILLWWFFPPLSHLYLTILTSSHTLTPLQHVIFFPPHVTLSALIGHLLYDSSLPPSHRSLNGLSPTTTSPRSHSSFPSPLSLSR